MFSIRFVKDLLLHQLRSKNRHGLHSPFVYKLVDTVIYDFRAKNVYTEVEKLRKKHINDNLPKIDQLLYRLVASLKPGNLVELGSVTETTKLYLQKATPAAFLSTNISSIEQLDCVLIAERDGRRVLKYFEECLPKVHENTMLVLTDIYRTGEMKQVWKDIKAHPKVTVTVDLFWIGLVFFRKGQVREDFWIKFA
ncbi:MAG TPA: hypothetical protein VGC01_05590 [Mucilaginibacter sp.]